MLRRLRRANPSPDCPRGEQHHSPILETGPLYALFKNWGNTSAAVWRAVPAQALALGAQTRARHTREQRERTDAVTLLPGDTRWRDAALAVRFFKPPGT